MINRNFRTDPATGMFEDPAPGALYVGAGIETADGTTYTWEDVAESRTRMTLRNRGEPVGVKSLAAPLMSRAMQSANRKDLGRLKAILEGNRR